MIRHLLFIAAFVSAIFASIPPQTVLTDALGSTRGLVDSAESLTDTYDYHPYGELSLHTGSSENSFLFTGEQLDQETDNYYLRARYYSPSLTKFLSRDTYDGRDYEPITLNHYLYANANPVIYVDPSGRITVMGIGASVSISSSLRATNQSVRVQVLRALMNQAVVYNSKGGVKGFLFDVIEDLAINAVMSTFGKKFPSKSVAGTAAHTEFEKLIREAFPGGGKISW